jgi:hypothetical protein
MRFAPPVRTSNRPTASGTAGACGQWQRGQGRPGPGPRAPYPGRHVTVARPRRPRPRVRGIKESPGTKVSAEGRELISELSSVPNPSPESTTPGAQIAAGRLAGDHWGNPGHCRRAGDFRSEHAEADSDSDQSRVDGVRPTCSCELCTLSHTGRVAFTKPRPGH